MQASPEQISLYAVPTRLAELREARVFRHDLNGDRELYSIGSVFVPALTALKFCAATWAADLNCGDFED